MTSTMSTWRSNQLSYNPIVTPTNNLSATATLTITRVFQFVNRNSRLFDSMQGLRLNDSHTSFHNSPDTLLPECAPTRDGCPDTSGWCGGCHLQRWFGAASPARCESWWGRWHSDGRGRGRVGHIGDEAFGLFHLMRMARTTSILARSL